MEVMKKVEVKINSKIVFVYYIIVKDKEDE